MAKAADIDTAMGLGHRHPTGLLRLSDGLDVRLDIACHLAAHGFHDRSSSRIS